ncbi:glycosyltransferase family 2 protein [Niabella hibiscisoli]|uniref:glycosyltransferase family 2 protein n=1 Tax=Niabella hibiscisoli TaxID=1825928 RepID=UPI001F0F6993|nr:glycosyltransferase family 2 protein [Niabella hibiscisoli]MCH5716526.1 glycosyltransferase [Niabella hibiscisoli]
MPKVSVILPNYNHGIYLQERIDSILNQTFQDFELIILDDVSIDNSRNVIEKYRGNPKISGIIYNEKNSGSTFKQWDKGVGLAKGEYIWFAESDDWCEPSMLKYLVDGIESDPDCAVSYCQAYCVDGYNKIRFTSHHTLLSEIKDGPAFIRDFMIEKTSIFNASMAIWKKSYYDLISKRFMDFKMCGDWLFWVQLATIGKVHISGRVLNYFRKHDNDVSGKMYKTGKGIVEEVRVLHIMINEDYISDKMYRKGLCRFIRAYYRARSSFSQEVKDEFKQELQKRFGQLLSKVLHQILQN